jgi:hypothetical protein
MWSQARGNFKGGAWPTCFLPAALCLLLATGCSGPAYDVAAVFGRVTLDQKPIEGVHVSFQPQASGKGGVNPGPGSFGVTDAEGRYRLELVEPDRPGAVVGPHRVRFALREERENIDDAGRPIGKGLPERYRDGSISFTVPPEGSDRADFELLSK